MDRFGQVRRRICITLFTHRVGPIRGEGDPLLSLTTTLQRFNAMFIEMGGFRAHNGVKLVFRIISVFLWA